jgi:diguanylate cyclase (GGDEF)-like protein
MISASLEEKKIFWIIQSFLLRELKSGHSAIYTLNGSDPVRIDEATHDGRRDRAMEEILDIALHASNPLVKMIEASEWLRFIERGQLTPGLFIFRFKCAGPADCFAVLLSPDRSVMNEAFESRLRMLKAQIEVTGKNIEQYKGVQHLVYVDDATGLYNTRYLNYILDREIAHSQATKKSFAVLFIDADKFKNINDSHGHLVGTKLLHELGEELKKYVRRTDTVFRYGGDEFVAVLAPCDLATAKTVADRIRDAVEHKTFLGSDLKLKFTVSIGVALFPDHARSKKSIIEAADHAMYNAKRTTRNSVTIAEISGKPPEETTSAEPELPIVAPDLLEAPSPTRPGLKATLPAPAGPAQAAASGGAIAAAAAAHVAAVIGTDDEAGAADSGEGGKKIKARGKPGAAGGE